MCDVGISRCGLEWQTNGWRVATALRMLLCCIHRSARKNDECVLPTSQTSTGLTIPPTGIVTAMQGNTQSVRPSVDAPNRKTRGYALADVNVPKGEALEVDDPEREVPIVDVPEGESPKIHILDVLPLHVYAKLRNSRSMSASIRPLTTSTTITKDTDGKWSTTHDNAGLVIVVTVSVTLIPPYYIGEWSACRGCSPRCHDNTFRALCVSHPSGPARWAERKERCAKVKSAVGYVWCKEPMVFRISKHLSLLQRIIWNYDTLIDCYRYNDTPNSLVDNLCRSALSSWLVQFNL